MATNLKTIISGVKGFSVAGIHGGLKKNGAPDIALILADRDCVGAGVFTTNKAQAAPVVVSQDTLKKNASQLRAVMINTTSANAMTGLTGIENAKTVMRWVAEHAQIQPEQVLVMSTGVIGTQLPMPKLEQGIPALVEALGQDWVSTAKAIMTTDTRPKLFSLRVYTMDGDYTIAGISKGAGMIAPNMATMLGVIVTDAKLTQSQAEQALKATNATTFNRIVIDGDMSTNDTVFLLASGASGVLLKTPVDLEQFQNALEIVMKALAQAIVRDGEGVTKFITLHITGAPDTQTAHTIAHTIATSPLVKTAFFGGDANWGRMIAAAGRAGVAFNPETARLWITAGEELFEGDKGLLLFEGGLPTRYSEADASEIFNKESIHVSLDLGLGKTEATVWTCDLSNEYVAINADYRS